MHPIKTTKEKEHEATENYFQKRKMLLHEMNKVARITGIKQTNDIRKWINAVVEKYPDLRYLFRFIKR